MDYFWKCIILKEPAFEGYRQSFNARKYKRLYRKFPFHILVNRCVSNFENYKKNWFQIMSLPVNLNRPASGTITSAVISIHTSSPKVYVTCQNVEVETEEIRNDIVHEAEVAHDGDIFLKVFHNADTAIDEPPSDHYGDEQFWLNRLAQQTYFLDDDDDDDNDIFGNIYQRHRAGAPQSEVW